MKKRKVAEGMRIKFNAMDFVIVLLILVVAVGGFLFLTKGNQTQTVTENAIVELSVEVARQEEGFSKLIKVGDEVVLGEKEKLHAKVKGIEVKPATMVGYDIVEGKTLESVQPNKYDVIVVLEGVGREADDFIKIGETPIRVGKNMAMKSKDWAGYGFVLTVDAKPEEV